MNILDLNEDIMSKIKHNLFLKSLMKHRNEFEIYLFDWNCWASEKELTGYYYDSRKMYSDVINNFNYSVSDENGNYVLHRCKMNKYS
eukprot:SAG11_NODE_7761_length_1099_cov_29.102000_1_plen_87_part_00